MTRSHIKTLPDLELPRTKPRSNAEWKTLKRWGELPESEQSVPGYLMRMTREEAGLTQMDLASKLGITQQAVAQGERWRSNPTIGLMASWAGACGKGLDIKINAKDASAVAP